MMITFLTGFWGRLNECLTHGNSAGTAVGGASGPQDSLLPYEAERARAERCRPTLGRTQHSLKAQASRLVLSSLHVQLAPISEALPPSSHGFTSSVQCLQVLPLGPFNPHMPAIACAMGRNMAEKGDFLMLLNFLPSSSSAPGHCRVTVPLDLLASPWLVSLVFCSLAFCLQTLLLLKWEALQLGI